jgi:hypothetical protein
MITQTAFRLDWTSFAFDAVVDVDDEFWARSIASPLWIRLA